MQMQANRAQTAAEDIFFGQVVIIWARWFVILAGIIFALWFSETPAQLGAAVVLLAGIMAINFFVHGRYLMEKPVNRSLLITLSFVDLVLVTAIVLLGPEYRGLDNYLFVFYYPLLVAFAFVFPPQFTTLYTLATLLAYTVACVTITLGLLVDSAGLEVLAMRLITMAAVGFLSTYYWRIQRDRRQAVTDNLEPIP